jgi:hypothetical protein
MMQDIVVKAARDAHKAHWQMSGDESTGDKLARLVTDKWQSDLKTNYQERFAIEYQVANHLRERIDVVDLVAGVAYELKVSPNNVHMEFYRDIFKVILARDNKFSHLKRFVFLTPTAGANRLMRGMGKAVIEDASRIGLSIEVIAL